MRHSLFASISGIIAGICLPALSLAAAVNVNVCISGSELSCNENFAAYLNSTIVNGLLAALGGIIFAAVIFYGLKLATGSWTDSALSNTWVALGQLFAGAVIVLGVRILAASFATKGVLDPAYAEAGIAARVVAYIIQTIGAGLILNLVIQGLRMILSTDESSTTTARKNIIQSIIGVAIVMLTVPIFRLIEPGTFNHTINEKIVGVANFIGTIFGILAVVAIIVSGIMLIVSVNESLKDRAKKIIITALVAIVVIAVSLGLIQVLLPAGI